MRLEVGHVARPHGLRGDVLVAPVTNVPHMRFVAGAVLWAGGVERQITESRPHGTRWIVHFAGVDDRDGAAELRGAVLEAPPLDDHSTLWAHELVGCEAVTESGEVLGRVESVEANPASDLLVLDTGALVPMTFVVDHHPGTVTVDVPEGLVEP